MKHTVSEACRKVADAVQGVTSVDEALNYVRLAPKKALLEILRYTINLASFYFNEQERLYKRWIQK